MASSLRKETEKKKKWVKLVDFNFLFLSSSISVGKGKLIPSKKIIKEKKRKEKEKVCLRMTELIRGYANQLA